MIFSAACASNTAPTCVEPVNESLRTLSDFNIALTAGPDGLGTTTLTTPSGTPARCKISAIASAVSGVSLAGFKTTVQPAAKAGPIFRVAIAAGKFHGVASSATPTGWRETINQFAPPGARR